MCRTRIDADAVITACKRVVTISIEAQVAACAIDYAVSRLF